MDAPPRTGPGSRGVFLARPNHVSSGHYLQGLCRLITSDTARPLPGTLSVCVRLRPQPRNIGAQGCSAYSFSVRLEMAGSTYMERSNCNISPLSDVVKRIFTFVFGGSSLTPLRCAAHHGILQGFVNNHDLETNHGNASRTRRRRCQASRPIANTGNRMAARIAMIAMTTSSSINVKPLFDPLHLSTVPAFCRPSASFSHAPFHPSSIGKGRLGRRARPNLCPEVTAPC